MGLVVFENLTPLDCFQYLRQRYLLGQHLLDRVIGEPQLSQARLLPNTLYRRRFCQNRSNPAHFLNRPQNQPISIQSNWHLKSLETH
jgi:hypothetical protein